MLVGFRPFLLGCACGGRGPSSLCSPGGAEWTLQGFRAARRRGSRKRGEARGANLRDAAAEAPSGFASTVPFELRVVLGYERTAFTLAVHRRSQYRLFHVLFQRRPWDRTSRGGFARTRAAVIGREESDRSAASPRTRRKASLPRGHD